MASLPFQQYTERMIGKGHPTLADTNNRALRELLEQSGYDPDADPFPGLMGPVFNVKAFGALGDGVTDDTVAIQAAIDAAAGVGVTFLPIGEYVLSDNLAIPSDTTLVGAGWESVLKPNWVLNSVASVYMVNEDTALGNTGITLRDFRLHGAHPGGPLGDPTPGQCSGILFRRGSNVRVRGVEIRNVPGIALAHQGISNFQAIANYVHDNGRDGITGGPFGDSPSDDVSIVANHILDCHDDHIACNMSVDTATPGDTPPRRWNILGNVIRGGSSLSADNFARGIMVHGGEDIEIVGNNVQYTSWATLHVTKCPETLTRCKGIRVVGNTFRYAGHVGTNLAGYGMNLDDIDDLTVVGNAVADSKDYGIQLADVDGFIVADNDVLRCGDDLAGVGFGVWLAGTSAVDRDVKNGRLANNRVAYNDAAGIAVFHCDDVDIIGNRSYNNGQSGVANTLQAGINLTGGGVIRIHDNACTDNQGSPTQRYGFSALTAAADYLSLKDNDFEGNSVDYWIMNTIPTVLHVEVEAKRQTPAFAASFTPDPRRGEIIQIGALTGNITVNDATALARIKGLRMTFVFTQDGTGGRTVSFNAVYKKSWSDTGNTLGLRSSISFEYDGTNWQQIGAQSPYV